MNLLQEREQLTEYGKRMSRDGLSVGTSGNLSIYVPEAGLMAITPSGLDYEATTPADIVVMDLDAHVVEGERKPSSEWALHTAFTGSIRQRGRWFTPIPCTARCWPVLESRWKRCIMPLPPQERPACRWRPIACSARRSWRKRR